MPKVAPELTALAVRRLAKQGLYAAGGVQGLLIRVTSTGHKYWLLRATVGGKRRDIGIGPYPEISLAQAREQAAGMRGKIRQGIDPVAERKATRDALRASQAATITFDQAAIRYIRSKEREFSSEKHAKQWRATLDTYAKPIIGALPVEQVSLAHIVQVLEPIWMDRTETASRLRGRIEKVLDYACVSGYRTGDNPARWKGNLDAVLPAPGKVKSVTHHKALDWREAPAFLVELRKREGMAARALEFILMTAARSGEVRGATWEEIGGDVWTVPAKRMKAGQEHVVPLSADAVAILKSVPRFEGSPYVFPGAGGRMLSDMALSALVRRMGVETTAHGLRSTFRDWVSECTNYPHEVAEKALAHKIASAVERAYRRGDLLDKRRMLMRDWCLFLSTNK